jgi:hypothetical protein
MQEENIFGRLKRVANFALAGAVTLSIALGWIDPALDWHPVGAILGATAASLRLFHVV